MTAPTFEPPPADDPNREVWLLRAPAHLDVSALLDGVALDVDPRAVPGGIVAAFQSDGTGYALRAGNADEAENVRLLVRDEAGSDDDDEEEEDVDLVAHRPFHRQVHLTSLMSGSGGGDPSELALAPSREAAPRPAVDKSGNGSVDAMRLAYAPVPQRQGLKRRWNMPGSNLKDAAKSALYASPEKKARKVKKEVDSDEDTRVDTVAAVAADDVTHVREAKQSSSKKVKREEDGTPGKSSSKKKKEKKKEKKRSKKSPKK